MTLGVGRKMSLDFTALAKMLEVAKLRGGFAVNSVVAATDFHENKVKGHQSWARAMGLVQNTNLTPLAHELLAHDPMLANPLSRGVCYVEIAFNPNAEVAHHICQVILPRMFGSASGSTAKEIEAMLIGDGVGIGSKAAGQPRTDADLFLQSLRSRHGFGDLGLLRLNQEGSNIAGTIQVEAELTGYALLRYWPNDKVYMRMEDVHRLLAPLLLSPVRFANDLSLLERCGFVVRVTSSGLDQVRPVTGRRAEEALWLKR